MQSGIPNKKIINSEYSQYLSPNCHIIIDYLKSVSLNHSNIGLFFSPGESDRIFYEADNKKCDLIQTKKAPNSKKLAKLNMQSDTAYLRYHDKLYYYYIDKTQKVAEKKITEVTIAKKPLSKAVLDEIDSMSSKKQHNDRELSKDELKRIMKITGHERMSLYDYFNDLLEHEVVINAFEQAMTDFSPGSAAQAFEIVHGIADALFEPVIQSEKWDLYWKEQCKLMSDQTDELKYTSEVVYRKLVNGFCFKILGLWSKVKLTAENKTMHKKNQIITKILSAKDLNEFILFCKKRIMDDCRSNYEYHSRIINHHIKNNSNLALSIPPLNPRKNVFFSLLENGDEFLNDCLKECDRPEREKLDMILSETKKKIYEDKAPQNNISALSKLPTFLIEAHGGKELVKTSVQAEHLMKHGRRNSRRNLQLPPIHTFFSGSGSASASTESYSPGRTPKEASPRRISTEKIVPVLFTPKQDAKAQIPEIEQPAILKKISFHGTQK